MRDDTASSLYASGTASYRATAYETAVQLFTEAIEQDPSQAKYFDARCAAYDKLGRIKSALLDARQVIRLAPQSHKGYLKAGKLFKLANRWDQAEQMLQQGLRTVASEPASGRAALEAELASVQSSRAKATFCPFERLPTEIFIEIIALALEEPADLDARARTRRKPPLVNTLFAARSVSRSWYTGISNSPRLWTSLRLDGEINRKNALAKAEAWAVRSLGHRTDTNRDELDGQQTKGLHSLTITAGKEFPASVLDTVLRSLFDMGALCRLRHFALSNVDGTHTATVLGKEAQVFGSCLGFLYEHCRIHLRSLVVCSIGRLYPDFEAASMFYAFPDLRKLHIHGCTSMGAPGVTSIRLNFLSPYNLPPPVPGEPDIDIERPPSHAQDLAITGSVLVTDRPYRAVDFVHLRTLDIDAAGAPTVWDLLSVPDLRQFHVTLYGEQRLAELPVPDLSKSWRCVESLRLGGAKQLTPRLLDAALGLAMRFDRLITLDLAYAELSTAHLALFDASNAPNLERLNLSSTTSLKPLSLPSLSSVKVLNVSHTLWVTDKTIESLVEVAPAIEQLLANDAVELTGRPIMQLVRHRFGPEEQTDGDVSSRDGTAASSAKRYSQLRRLELDGCKKIEDKAVEWLRASLPPAGFVFNYFSSWERGKPKKSRAA